MIWIYDGQWEGLLSAVFCVFAQKDNEADIRSRREFSGPSLFPVREVDTDPEKARRVLVGMKRLSGFFPETAYCAFLSELSGRESALLQTLRLGFGRNLNPLPLRQHESVRRLQEMSFRVRREQERLLGVIRFRKIRRASAELFVSDIEPDTFVLPLLGGHFHARFGSQICMIRDVRRRVSLISNQDEWFLAELPARSTKDDMANACDAAGDAGALSVRAAQGKESELSWQDLGLLPENDAVESIWRAYFKAVANPYRENTRLQRQFLPMRYRRYMTEFEE